MSRKFVAGPARLTNTRSRRGWRSCAAFTGTGLAYPSTGSCARTAIAGRMIDPNGSMCGTGFSVSRPARFAVSSPNQLATTPWLTSWQITAATRQPKKMAISRKSTLPELAGLRRAGDAELRRRHRLEARLADLATAGFAAAVLAVVELREGVFDLTERVRERSGERLDLRALRGDLTRVGETSVERQAAVGSEPELTQLAAQSVALFLK